MEPAFHSNRGPMAARLGGMKALPAGPGATPYIPSHARIRNFLTRIPGKTLHTHTAKAPAGREFDQYMSMNYSWAPRHACITRTLGLGPPSRKTCTCTYTELQIRLDQYARAST